MHDIYRAPAHPYTKGLLDSIPRVDQKGQDLYAIKGLPPNLLDLPTGCSFHPRCPYRQDNCVTDVPRSTRSAARAAAPATTGGGPRWRTAVSASWKCVTWSSTSR
ncbi:oligopeptide/dipeptide ABC transporter ATP-binding protein [Nonomuraea thailandensis]